MGKILKAPQSPKSRFLKVGCPDCEAEQITFSKPSVKVNCQVCGATLVEPKGGAGVVRGNLLDTIE